MLLNSKTVDVRLKGYIFVGLSALLMASCSVSKNFTALTSSAESYYSKGEYAKATAAWQQIIADYGKVGSVFTADNYLKAAKAAVKSGNDKLAFQWYDTARLKGQSSPDLWLYLAHHYHKIDNLSKELDALGYYFSFDVKGTDALKARERYFEALVESENYEQAFKEWPLIENDVKSNKDYVEMYFEVCQSLNREPELNKAQEMLLKLDPTNEDALFRKARTLYDAVEKRYKNEMDAYEKNHTRSQYSKLLKALKGISADYRTARNYFEKLYTAHPSKKYATYLANIYARLDNKSKSDYWRHKSE
ncbi:hypothetical protein PbJCM13498_13840 [Prolixibacter bellariivorans]|uniref:Lipoprotein n=1 Tax=Prolixibacter bellariivorans TaxID=314319 RepID=A0A5M4AY15_9BACT|nr:hypothetical protein PbJCM13498_13840 [Prolixibacter bellariivorans]